MRRTSFVVATIALLTACQVASAAPRPHITDPAGDVLTSNPAYDITAVTFDSDGKLVNRRFVPTHLLVRMDLAAPPRADNAHNYSVSADVGGCRFWAWVYYFGRDRNPHGGWYIACRPPAGQTDLWWLGVRESTNYLPPKIVGRALVWRLAYKHIAKPVRPGALLTRLHAYTSVNETSFGIGPSDYVPRASLDYAESEHTYRLGDRHRG